MQIHLHANVKYASIYFYKGMIGGDNKNGNYGNNSTFSF
jgi:hypothetical protein